MSPTFNMAGLSHYFGDSSNLYLRKNIFQTRENDIGVSLRTLIFNFIHLGQIVQVEKDLKIARKKVTMLLVMQITLKPQIQELMKVQYKILLGMQVNTFHEK